MVAICRNKTDVITLVFNIAIHSFPAGAFLGWEEQLEYHSIHTDSLFCLISLQETAFHLFTGSWYLAELKKKKKSVLLSGQWCLMETSSLMFSASEDMLAFIQMRVILAFASSALEVESNSGLPSHLSSGSCGRQEGTNSWQGNPNQSYSSHQRYLRSLSVPRELGSVRQGWVVEKGAGLAQGNFLTRF